MSALMAVAASAALTTVTHAVTFTATTPTADGKTTLKYDAGPDHPFVEVWVSKGGKTKVHEDDGDGKGEIEVTLKQGWNFFILTDHGVDLKAIPVPFNVKPRGVPRPAAPAPAPAPAPKPPKILVKKPTKLTLERLEYFRRTAGDGDDTLRLKLYLPPAGSGPISFRTVMGPLNKHSTTFPKSVSGPHDVVTKIARVELWEIDTVSKDDCLGRFTIDLSKEPIGPRSVRFTGDGGNYLLHYRLD
jgi:hypothetical protein